MVAFCADGLKMFLVIIHLSSGSFVSVVQSEVAGDEVRLLFRVYLIGRMLSKTMNWNECGSACSLILRNCPDICLDRLEGHEERH